MINSRKIDDLDPEVRVVCNLHLLLCRDAGIELLVTSTWRDIEAQDALYAIGRTVHLERRTVTKAKGGKSWHNFKAAYDVVPLVGGKPIWNGKDPVWLEVIRIGKLAGAGHPLEWDLCHFEVRPQVKGIHINLTTAMTRFKSNGTIFMV